MVYCAPVWRVKWQTIGNKFVTRMQKSNLDTRFVALGHFDLGHFDLRRFDLGSLDFGVFWLGTF